jgi:hypothetical protein
LFAISLSAMATAEVKTDEPGDDDYDERLRLVHVGADVTTALTELVKGLGAVQKERGAYLKSSSIENYSTLAWPEHLRVVRHDKPRCTTLLLMGQHRMSTLMTQAARDGTVDFPFSTEGFGEVFKTTGSHVVPLVIKVTESSLSKFENQPFLGLAFDLVVKHADGTESTISKTEKAISSAIASRSSGLTSTASAAHHHVTNIRTEGVTQITVGGDSMAEAK